jgi:hypothetical protein
VPAPPGLSQAAFSDERNKFTARLIMFLRNVGRDIRDISFSRILGRL